MDKNDFYVMKNPVTEYQRDAFPKQEQPYPGLPAEMKPVPDCGEKSYVGFGRLKGRKALSLVVIAYAREGADVAVNYLPSEEEDARDVQKYSWDVAVTKGGLLLNFIAEAVKLFKCKT
jgi:hypothetical protein